MLRLQLQPAGRARQRLACRLPRQASGGVALGAAPGVGRGSGWASGTGHSGMSCVRQAALPGTPSATSCFDPQVQPDTSWELKSSATHQTTHDVAPVVLRNVLAALQEGVCQGLLC